MVWLPRLDHYRTNAGDKDREESIVRPTRVLSGLPGHLHQYHWRYAGRESPRNRAKAETRVQGRINHKLLHLALGAVGQFLRSPAELSSARRPGRSHFLEHLLVLEDEQEPLGRRKRNANAGSHRSIICL